MAYDLSMIDHHTKEVRNMSQIPTNIRGGAHDDELDAILAAVRDRQKALAPTVWDFAPGDKVRFTNTTRPQYMRGMLATVVARRQTKVTVRIDRDHGRYRAGANIVCPTSILEKI